MQYLFDKKSFISVSPCGKLELRNLQVFVDRERTATLKKLVSLILALVLMSGLGVSAMAQGMGSRACTVIGADLTDEQITTVYQRFGFTRGAVPELRLTNAEERFYLEGFIDSAQIGTYSISCVFVQLMEPGTGIQIGTSNVTWCSSQMYVNALATAGVSDALIIVTAPFPVSGTAALAGIYKAYETMLGQALSAEAKQAGTQELTVTGELAEEFGSASSSAIVQEIKSILDETKAMDDFQLEQRIRQIAQSYNVRLTDTQVGQLMSLCRTLAALDVGALKDGVEGVQDTIGKIGETKDQVVGFFEKARAFLDKLENLIDKLSALLGE